jgi:hypothetical protein
MPGMDIEKVYQDRYTLAPPSRAGSPPVQWYNLRPLFILLPRRDGDLLPLPFLIDLRATDRHAKAVPSLCDPNFG